MVGGGRKPKKSVKVVAVVTSEGIEGSFVPEPRRPLIAHLQVHSSEVQFTDMPIQYDPKPPTQPEPYDALESNLFNSKSELLEETQAETPLPETSVSVAVVPTTQAVPLAAFVRSDLMIHFRDCVSTQKLPETTEVACFWCAHSFEDMPCIIPEREDKGLYRVYGNFCSPECAVSYLLNESMDPHVRWERMALLNRIYDRAGRERIFPAPARETLKLFGGPVSIESFRATLREGKVRVDLHIPPMVSILGSIDTKPIDFFDTTIKANLTAPAAATATQREEGLRLKRSKPLKDPNSTLDAVMNIQMKGRVTTKN